MSKLIPYCGWCSMFYEAQEMDRDAPCAVKDETGIYVPGPDCPLKDGVSKQSYDSLLSLVWDFTLSAREFFNGKKSKEEA